MKKSFFAGLVVLLPIALTLFVAYWILGLMSRPFYMYFLNIVDNQWVAEFCSFILVCSTLVVVGVLGRWVLFRHITKLMHKLFLQIPLFNKLYQALTEVVTALLQDEDPGFSKAVLVPYPTQEERIVGFIPRQNVPICSTLEGGDLIPVFIPGSPNPLMGFLLFFRSKDVQEIVYPVPSSLRFVISCGLIPFDEQQPHGFQFVNKN